MLSSVAALLVAALLISSAAAQSCSSTTCESCFGTSGCVWSPVTVGANSQITAGGQCLASGNVNGAAAAYAALVVSSQYCGLANCVGNFAVALTNGQEKCGAGNTFFNCVINNFCNNNGAICTQQYRSAFCQSYWTGLQCSGTCPFASTSGGTTTGSNTTPKTLPPSCFFTSLFNTLSAWTWSTGNLSTNALTWFANFRTCLATAAANYIANTGTITCDNFQSALNDAFRTCGNNANGASICTLSGAEIQSFLSTNPAGNNTQVLTSVRLALQNCPASKYTETRFTFPGLSVTQVQNAAAAIVARVCSILNINPCNRVTFIAAVSGSTKRQTSATAVVAISADQGQDAAVQAGQVVAQQNQVAQAAGTNTVAASSSSGTCSVSPASTMATVTPVVIAAVIIVALFL